MDWARNSTFAEHTEPSWQRMLDHAWTHSERNEGTHYMGMDYMIQLPIEHFLLRKVYQESFCQGREFVTKSSAGAS